MRKLKSILFIFVLSTLLTFAVSSSWSAKPQQFVTEYGYVTFDESMQIRSDGLGTGVYADCSLGGKDYVRVSYLPDYSLYSINMMLGKMQNYPDTNVKSDRFVKFCFDVLGTPLIDFQSDKSNKAVYYILEKFKTGQGYDWKNDYTPRSLSKGFIDDNSVRAQIFTSNVSGGNPGVINFLVDPSPNADCTDSRAINNEKINAFYDDDPTNLSYTDTATYGEGGQTFYKLNFENGFSVVRTGRSWEIAPKSGNVTLSVLKYRNKKGVSDTVYLATYEAGTPIQFRITVSLDNPPQAPRKYTTAITKWGDIKQ